MPWTSLDHALLHEDVAAEVTAENLDTLSPAQLAIATGREDLDFLTRFRAGMAFRDRYCNFRQDCAFEEGGTVYDPSGGLFFAPLEYAVPEDLDDYTPTELLLLPFNRLYSNNDLVKEAAARFRHLALTHQTRRPTPSLPSATPSRAPTPGPQVLDAGRHDDPKHLGLKDSKPSPTPEPALSLPALSCSFKFAELKAPREIEFIQVKVTEDNKLVISEQGYTLLTIPGEKVEKFDVQTDHKDCTVMELKAEEALLGQSEELDCSIRLDFGTIDRDEPVFASISRRIAAWVKDSGGSTSSTLSADADASLPPSKRRRI